MEYYKYIWIIYFCYENEYILSISENLNKILIYKICESVLSYVLQRDIIKDKCIL